MNETQLNMKQRITWIDCAKGISMLLVIFSHSVHGALRGAIFSFHMPLFFVLSCMTYRCSENFYQWKSKTKKAAVHLVKPALTLFLLMIAIEIVTALLEGWTESINISFFRGKLLTLFFASGANFSINGVIIDRLGIPWFLIALFLGRSLFDLLHLKIKDKAFTIVCIVLTVTGVAAGQKYWLPLSFDVALAALFFLLCGQWMKNFDISNNALKKMLCAALIWASTLLFTEKLADGYLELAVRRYPLFPLCYLTAVAGTLMVSEFSFLLTKYARKIIKPISFCGEHSLMLLCVHTMDFLWEWIYESIGSSEFISAVIRVILDLCVFVALMFVKKKIKKEKVEAIL